MKKTIIITASLSLILAIGLFMKFKQGDDAAIVMMNLQDTSMFAQDSDGERDPAAIHALLEFDTDLWDRCRNGVVGACSELGEDLLSSAAPSTYELGMNLLSESCDQGVGEACYLFGMQNQRRGAFAAADQALARGCLANEKGACVLLIDGGQDEKSVQLAIDFLSHSCKTDGTSSACKRLSTL